MKRVVIVVLLLCGFAVGAKAQAVDAEVCAIVKNPVSFDGKIVRIKGIAFAGYDQFVIKAADVCGFPIDSIWLEYPAGTKGKAGPVAMITVQPAHNYSGPYKAPARTAVTLDKSKDFKTFDSDMSATRKGPGMCMGCFKSTVSATFVGRIDAVASTTLKRDKDGKITDFGGFGNANAYPVRLVLQSVSDIAPKDIDYSKQMAPYKDQRDAPGGFGAQPGMVDAVSQARDLSQKMVGMPAGETVQKNLALFPKSGDHNGVVITYNPANELPKDEIAQKDAPDGVQYNVFLNLDRLDSTQQSISIIHLSGHLADLKSAGTGEAAPLFVTEYNSWSLTLLGAVVGGQRTLGLPDGGLVWDGSWGQDVRNDNIDKALRAYLATAALSQ